MSLVNVPNINNNDDATPDLFNSRFADIVDVINGNIDATNITDNSITYAKLALASLDIPISKLALIPGTTSGSTREGGSIQIGSWLVQWGETDISTATVITFNTPYATNPQIVLTARGGNVACWIVSKTTTTATVSAASPVTPTSWVAIGKSA